MKKTICLILALTLTSGLFGCSVRNGENAGTDVPATETAEPETATPAPEDFSALYIRTDGYVDGAKYPIVTVIQSRAELDAYIESNKDTYDLERRETPDDDSAEGFMNAADSYDDSFFENGTLVLVLLEENSGSIRHEVTNVAFSGGEWHISIARNVPEIGTDDMAEWHILVELDRLVGVSDTFNVILS